MECGLKTIEEEAIKLTDFGGGGGRSSGLLGERERERERVKAILVVACGGYPWQFGTI